MSYGYGGGNGRRGGYGGGGRRGGGGFQPKPRPILPEEHALHPLIEAACKHENKAMLRDFGTRGTEVSKDTVVLDGDPTRRPIPVPVAAMYVGMQFGIHMDHPDFPPLEKFETNTETTAYYARYMNPIMWQHNTEETDFRHIPCYTRYVIDKHRRILNAYNGKEIVPANAFMVELVPDGPANKLSKVSIDFLMFLAYAPLPDDFRDYGFRTYSHDFGMDIEGRQYGLIKKGKVKVKNNEVNMVAEYNDIEAFKKQCLAPRDFELLKEISMESRGGLKGKILNVGPFSIRESIAYVPPAPIPPVKVDAQVQTNDFDSPAPQQQAQQQAPQQQQMQQPAQQEPKVEDVDFGSIDF